MASEHVCYKNHAKLSCAKHQEHQSSSESFKLKKNMGTKFPIHLIGGGDDKTHGPNSIFENSKITVF